MGFDVVIGRVDNGSDRRHTFVRMICDRSGTYQSKIRKLKRDETDRGNVSVCLNCADTIWRMRHGNLM